LRRFVAVILATVAFGAVSSSAAVAGGRNPSSTGTGPPSQSCQQRLITGGTTPGSTASSPGSPFNEPGFGSSPGGGTGGSHYSANSQYDVACYHVSNKP
jgi:hypothetical protein